jgi:hypothetical protein
MCRDHFIGLPGNAYRLYTEALLTRLKIPESGNARCGYLEGFGGHDSVRGGCLSRRVFNRRARAVN